MAEQRSLRGTYGGDWRGASSEGRVNPPSATRPSPVATRLLLLTLLLSTLIARAGAVTAATCRQLVFNPGFEEGALGWETASRNASPLIVPEAAFRGRYGARLGGTNQADDRLSQPLTFPTDLATATLRFYLRLETEDTRAPGADRFTVRLLDAAGQTPLFSITELDNRKATNGWVYRVHPLTPAQVTRLAGQTVRLAFQLTSDASAPTTVSLDEIEFEACTGGAPAVRELHMSDAPAGRARDAFPPGTHRVYIRFQYANLSARDVVRVIVRDPMGIPLLDRRFSELTGNGTLAIPLTGREAVARILETAEAAGTSMVDNARQALEAKERMRFSGHAQQALTAGYVLGNALTQLSHFGPDAAMRERLTSAQAHLQAAMEALQRALDQTLSFEEARAHMRTAHQRAQQTTAEVIAMRSLPLNGPFAFPPTVNCTFYLTNVYLDGSPAASFEWRVGTPGLPARIHPPSDPQRGGVLRVDPPLLYTQGVNAPNAPHQATVTGRVVDGNCLPVADGNPVVLSLDNPMLGVLQPEIALTRDGYFTATVSTTQLLGPGVLTVRAQAGNAQAVIPLFLVGPPARLRLRTLHNTLDIGQSTPVVVHVVDALGQNVADGTEITFRVLPSDRGSVAPATARTTGGYAGTTFTAGLVGGEVQIIAQAGPVQSHLRVRVIGPTPTPTQAPTATLAPSPTPTPSPTPAVPCDRDDPNRLCNAQVLVRVFEDQRCDRGFTAGVDRPLLEVPVSLIYPDGRSVLRYTDRAGYAYFGDVRLDGDERLFVLVEYPEELVMRGLTPCPNSSTYAVLDRSDFGPWRSAAVTFRAHHRMVTREGYLRPTEASVCFSARYYLEPTDGGPTVFILTERELTTYLDRHVRVTGSAWEVEFCNYLRLTSLEAVP